MSLVIVVSNGNLGMYIDCIPAFFDKKCILRFMIGINIIMIKVFSYMCQWQLIDVFIGMIIGAKLEDYSYNLKQKYIIFIK